MTLCVGYNAGEYLYLAADSTVSTNDSKAEALWGTSTSFGEAAGYRDGTVRGEVQLKVLPIGQATSATFTSNDSKKTAAIIAEFARVLEGRSAAEALDLAAARKPSLGVSQQIIVADGRKSPAMCVYDSNQDTVTEVAPNNVLVLGSGRRFVQESLLAVIGELSKTPMDPSFFITTLLAFLQGESLRQNLMPYGVGGAFHGAVVHKGGRFWQPDICYFRYDSTIAPDENDTWEPVYTMFRDDVLSIGSNVKDHLRRLTFGPETEAWRRKWRNFVLGYQKHGRFDYWVFCDSSEKREVVLQTMKLRDSAFQLTILSESRMGFSFSDSLRCSLFDPPTVPLLIGTPEFASEDPVEIDIGKLYATYPHPVASLKVDEIVRQEM